MKYIVEKYWKLRFEKKHIKNIDICGYLFTLFPFISICEPVSSKATKPEALFVERAL